MTNALTIDVEDYFQVNAFAKVVRRDDWHKYPLRVAENTLRILDVLDELQKKATFFTLGWVAEREPALVKEIHQRGHEVACHGYGHELIYDIGPERFREDVSRAKAILEQTIGAKVSGYRAPSYSITGRSLWALDILVEEGFAYDSSIFPVLHDVYGIPGASRFPHRIDTSSGSIAEFPITTLRLQLAGVQLDLPVAGGGYLRLLPARFIRYAFSSVIDREKKPVLLYFHPWEIDPGQPRIQAPLKSRLRHYVNIPRTMDKITYILKHFEFSTMRDVLEKEGILC